LPGDSVKLESAKEVRTDTSVLQKLLSEFEFISLISVYMGCGRLTTKLLPKSPAQLFLTAKSELYKHHAADVSIIKQSLNLTCTHERSTINVFTYNYKPWKHNYCEIR
jgi:hypothetical protein